MARVLLCLALLALILLLGSSEAKTASPKAKAKPKEGPTCRDRDGTPVDWWTAIKLPRFKASDAGDDYVYVDSTYTPPDASQEGPAGSLKWTPGHGLGDANTGPLAQTLLPLYSEAAFGMVAYNDEYPESLSADPTKKVPSFWPGGAHAKGVLGLGETKGFWLVHSMPQFPGTLEEGYFGIGPHQLKFGQSLLCISLAAAQLDTVGQALQTSGLWIFTAALPGDLGSAYPSVAALTGVGDDTPSVVDGAPPIVAGEQITSLGGQDFVVFAKGPTAYNGGRMIDLYEEVVEPYFEEPFAWETWQVGRNNDLPSGCGGGKSEFLSYTIASVSIPEADPAVDPSMPGNTWGVNHDHSKWGVPYSVGKAVLYKTACVGDINRQSSQAVRGGGTVCFEKNNAIFESYRKLLADVEMCTQTQDAPPPAKGRKTVKKTAATGKFPKKKAEL